MTSSATIKPVTVVKNEVATPTGKPTKCAGDCCHDAKFFIRKQPGPTIVVMHAQQSVAKIGIKYCPFCGGKLV